MFFQAKGSATALKSVAILNLFFYVLTSVILLAAVFLIIKPALAQSETPAEAPADVAAVVSPPSGPVTEVPSEPALAPEPSVTEPVAPVVEKEQPISAEAQMDSKVTLQDLGASNARILPNSFFYGFKRFGRSIKEALTFNPVEKAELKLEHANQELADATKLIEQQPTDSKAIEAVAGSLDRFQNKIADLKNMAQDLQKEQAGGDENVGKFITNILDKQIKQQKVFELIEGGMIKNLPPQFAGEMFEKIDAARQATAENVAGVVTGVVQDADSLTSYFDAAMQNQGGSEFKDIKNLSALKRVEQFVPEFAKAAIRQAQENAFKRFGAQMEKIPAGEMGQKFEDYVGGISGDGLRNMEIFDQLENTSDLPPEIMGKMEMAKDITARRFQDQIEQAGQKYEDAGLGQQMQGRYFSSVATSAPDVGQLRVMEEMRKRVNFDDSNLNQEMENQRSKMIDNFQGQFNQPDGQGTSEEFTRFSEQMAQRPDPTTFQIMNAFEDKMKADPKKLEMLDKMRQEVKVQFVEQAQKEPDKFFSRITTNNPEDLAVFSQLKEEFKNNPEQFLVQPPNGNLQPMQTPQPFQPAQMNKFFDQAIQKQTEVITGQLGEIENPEEFEQFNKKFEGMKPEMMKTFNQQAPNFQQSFNYKQEFIQDLKMKQPEGQGSTGEQAPNTGNLPKENFQGQPQQNGLAPKPMMQQQSSGFQNPEFKPQPVNDLKPEFQVNQFKEPTMNQPINNNQNGGFEKPGTFSQNPAPQQIQQPQSGPAPAPSGGGGY